MSFTGKEGAAISLEEARQMIATYEQKCGSEDRRSHFAGRQLLDEVLALEDCVGLRIFHAERDGQRELVVVGEDKSGALMLPNEGELKTKASGQSGTRQIVDSMRPCPPQCSPYKI